MILPCASFFPPGLPRLQVTPLPRTKSPQAQIYKTDAPLCEPESGPERAPSLDLNRASKATASGAWEIKRAWEIGPRRGRDV